MKRLFLILLLVTLFTIVSSSQAQTATPTMTATANIEDYDWCVEYDFTETNGNFVNIDFSSATSGNQFIGNWVDGVGWVSSNANLSSSARTVEGIAIRNNTTAQYRRIDLFYSATMGGLETGDARYGARGVMVGIDTGAVDQSKFGSNQVLTVHVNGGGYSQFTFYSVTDMLSSHNRTTSGDAVYHKVQIYGLGTNTFVGYTSLCGATPTPEGTEEPEDSAYAYPLIDEDFSTWGMIRHNAEPDTPQENTVLAFSAEPNNFVRAGAEGTVQSVTKMRNYDCPHYFDGGTSIPFGTCSFTLSDEITGNGQHDYHLPGDSLSPLNGERDFYEVVINVLDSDDTLHYLVVSAPLYVEEGQIVGVGCVMGRTMVMKGLGFGIGSDGIDLGVTESPYGVTVVTVENPDGTIIDGLPLLSVEPPVEPPCNQAENFEGCLGDATLSDPQSWQTKNATFTGSGVILDGEGYIQTTMNLISAQEPEMIVYARGLVVSVFDMQLGQTIETFGSFDITPGEFKDYIIPGDEHLPDFTTMYTVKVTNTSGVPLEIGYICVRHTGGEDLEPPSGETGNCTFLNHNFYEGTEHWDGTISPISGGVAVADGEAISQNITLEPGTYYLKISLQLHYVNFTPDAADTTNKLLVEYEFPSGNGYETAAEFTAAQIAKDKNILIIKVPFTVASTTSSDFSIRATLDGFASNPVYGVIYQTICIVPTSQDGPLVETCTPMAEPSGDAFGGWVRWLWHNQNRFFQCDLMIMLNNMYNIMVQSFKLMGWSQRYGMAVTQAGLDWTGYSLLPWVAGYLSNIQPAILTQDAGCNSMWCLGEAIINGLLSVFDRLFDTLDWLLKAIVQPIFDLLLWLVTGLLMLFMDLLLAIIGLIFLFVIELIRLFLLAKDFLIALILAWNNSTPTALPFMWDCTTFTDIHSFCWVLWMIEHTILGGTVGSLIIPVFVSLGYILLAIYAVKRIQKLIRETGEAL